MKDNPYICPNCGKTTNANTISIDTMGWYTDCVHCNASFGIAIEEITTDREYVFIKITQKQFINLVLLLDRRESIAFMPEAEQDASVYSVAYTTLIYNKVLAIGGNGHNTRSLDIEGLYGDELITQITDFIEEYLKYEGFEHVYVDCDSVDYKGWSLETLNNS